MTSPQVNEAPPSTLVCIDLGTTTTRVWRVSGDGRQLARLQAPVGVRDTAREGSAALLRRTLHGLIAQASAPIAGSAPPARVIAAGMITSSLGLREIPHIPAPAGLAELAAATKPHAFPDVTDLPVLLVPGIRFGPPLGAEAAPVGETDIMRGEETLCVGLHRLGRAPGGAMLLNLGSHWKTIGIDADGRVVSSVTTLSGEMMHAVHERTILASALPAERPDAWDQEWVEAGMREERASGLARALFCVRLLQLAGSTTPQDRQAYLAGAFIAADMGLVTAAAAALGQMRMLLAGNHALARAWHGALRDVSIEGVILDEPTVEAAMLAGLCALHARMPANQPAPAPLRTAR